MIFGPALLPLVLDGSKTQTRRPARDGVPCRYAPGRPYAVQPARTAAGVARLRVLTVERKPLGALTDAEAVLEGFAHRDAFFDYWRRLHGAVDLAQAVWVITFRLEEPQP